MTAGSDMERARRLELVRRAEERYGLPPSTKMATLDLTGAVYAGGGELDIEPTWFDMPGLSDAGNDSTRRTGEVRRLGRGNSAAFALIESFARAYREPPLYVWAGPYMDIEASERLSDHPVCRADGLLRRPCPGANITMGALRAAIAKAKIVAGNCYLVKARTGGGDVLTNTTGQVVRLWPVWPTQMWPATYDKTDGRQSNGWIDYYAYDIGKGKPLQVPAENVIHFRNGMDPRNPRVGLGVVEEFALEVASDAEAALLVKSVMSNLGIPGLVFSPEDVQGGQGISEDDRAAIKSMLMAKTTGRRRGEPIVLSRPTRLEQFDVNLEVLNLQSVWEHVESRISAVIGWPAILAGLQAGLESATYSNANSLKRFATENAAIPTWVDDSEVWTDELAPEFGLGGDEYIAYDYPSVRALQEDQNDRWKRIGEAFGRNEITVGQHHHLLGLDLPEGVDPNLRQADIEKGAGGGITINMPGAADASPGVAAVSTEEAAQAAAAEASSISAAKISVLRDYAMGVASGQIERAAAVAQIMYTFNVTRDQAESFLGPEGTPVSVVERLATGKAKALLAKAVERFQPPAGDKPLTAAELYEGELTAEEVSAAIQRMADRLSEVDPAMAGILGAETEQPEEEGEKRLPFPTATKADPRKRTWIFDPDSQRYRWPNTGRLVPEGRVFRARERMIEDSRRRMRGIAEDYSRGDISLSQMQKRMRQEYTDQHIGLRALGRGGEKQLTRADRQAISEMVVRENQYLAGFARDIADGKMTEAEILARAEMYAGANMRQEYAAGRMAGHVDAGYTHKKRVGPNDDRTCPTCSSEIDMGWVPITASGFVIGETDCQSRDRCEIIFSRELPSGGRMY